MSADKPYRILALDGGGIRGAAGAAVLNELEKDLQLSLYDSFDLIAGTSTGGLIALALGAQKATGSELLELYNPLTAKKIMPMSFWDEHLPLQNQPKFDGKGKTKVLKRVLGKTLLNTVKKPVLITAYDIVAREIVVFKNNRGASGAYNPPLWEVADATSAAPTYFPAVKSSDQPTKWLVDGGLAANDPSMCAIADALDQGIKLENIHVLSLGTGIPTRYKDIGDKYGKSSQNWGAIGWMKNGLIDHFMAANSSTVQYHCSRLLDNRFVRVNGYLDKADDDLDNVKTGNIQLLKEHGVGWYQENKTEILSLF